MICSKSIAESPLPSEDRTNEILELARSQCQEEGVLEIDDNAQISEGRDNGCYVAAWVWVDFADTQLDKEAQTAVTEPDPEPCPGCKGLGWALCNTELGEATESVIRRCDACEKFSSDSEAVEAAAKAAQDQPGLLRLVEKIASLKHEREVDEEDPFERTSEDYIATLNELILEARQLLGTADKCSQCCELVPYVIGCPNGAELCEDCFAAGEEADS